MRSYAISTLVLVLALMTGACAGRQVRTRFVQAPPPAEAALTADEAETTDADAASDEASDDVAQPAVADQAPAVPATEEPKLTVQQQIDKYVADEIAAHNAAVRAAADKLHSTKMPPSLANEDEIVAALKIDATRVRERDRQLAKEFAAMWHDFDVMIGRLEADRRASRVAAAKPRPRPKATAAGNDDGREAVVGSLALASPPSEDPAAPAAPSIVNAEAGTPNVLASSSPTDRAQPRQPETLDLFVPSRAAVERSQEYWSHYLFGAMCAAFVGVLFGLLAGWRRHRRFKALADRPYDRYPDGTILMQEVVAGTLVTREVFPSVPPEPRSEPEATEQERRMDVIESDWHAAGDAMKEAPLSEPPTRGPYEFDFTDTPVEPLVAPLPVEKPSSEPKTSDGPPRLASGSGQLISSSDAVLAVSGITDVADPPREPRRESEAKVILYEDDSATPAPPLSAAPN